MLAILTLNSPRIENISIFFFSVKRVSRRREYISLINEDHILELKRGKSSPHQQTEKQRKKSSSNIDKNSFDRSQITPLIEHHRAPSSHSCVGEPNKKLL